MGASKRKREGEGPRGDRFTDEGLTAPRPRARKDELLVSYSVTSRAALTTARARGNSNLRFLGRWASHTPLRVRQGGDQRGCQVGPGAVSPGRGRQPLSPPANSSCLWTLVVTRQAPAFLSGGPRRRQVSLVKPQTGRPPYFRNMELPLQISPLPVTSPYFLEKASLPGGVCVTTPETWTAFGAPG